MVKTKYLSPPSVLVEGLSNCNPSFVMVPSYRLVLYRTIDSLGSPYWTLHQFGFLYSKNDLLFNLSPPTVLDVVLLNLNPSFVMVPSYRLVLNRTLNRTNLSRHNGLHHFRSFGLLYSKYLIHISTHSFDSRACKL